MPDSSRATSGLQEVPLCPAFAGAEFVVPGPSWISEWESSGLAMKMMRVYIAGASTLAGWRDAEAPD